MQIQDDRRQLSSTGDTKPTSRINSSSFAALNVNSSFDLFAEIFQAIAVSAPPAIKPNQRPAVANDNDRVETTAEAADDDAEKIESDDRAHSDPIALPIGLKVPPKPPLRQQDVEPVADQIAPFVDETTSEYDALATSKEAVNDRSLVINSPAKSEQQATPTADTDLDLTVVDQAGGADPQASILATPLRSTDNKPVDPIVVQPLANSQIDTATDSAKPTDDLQVAPASLVASDRAEPQLNDRRDRRNRLASSDERSGNVARTAAGLESRFDAAAASSNADARSIANANPTSESQANSSQLNAALQPSSPTAATPIIAAVSSSAVTQNPVAVAATSIGKVTSETPIVGGLTQSGSQSAGQAKTTDTPASRQAEIADRARLVHRIAKAFQRLSVEGGKVRLKMHPEELGGVQLEMQVSGRTVNAKVIAENEPAKQLLQDSLPELRQRLESQGLIVQKLEVTTRSDADPGGLPNQNQDQTSAGFGNSSHRDESRPRASDRLTSTKEATLPTSASRRGSAIDSDRSLDLQV